MGRVIFWRWGRSMRADPKDQVDVAGAGPMKPVLDQVWKVFFHPVAGKFIGTAEEKGVAFLSQKGDGIDPQRKGVLWKSCFDVGFDFFPSGLHHNPHGQKKVCECCEWKKRWDLKRCWRMTQWRAGFYRKLKNLSKVIRGIKSLSGWAFSTYGKRESWLVFFFFVP